MDEKRKNKIKNDKLPSKDDLIVDYIKDQLEEKMQASAMDINVFCKDGFVHMYEMVDVLAEKKLADEIAKNIDGVRNLESKITIAMDSNITDKHMEREVFNRLSAAAHSEDLVGVGVKVHAGVANLVGVTDNLFQAHEAMDLASQVRGIKDVVNNIQVSTAGEYDDVVINSKITQALSQVDISYQDIAHSVKSGLVTLNGYVDDRHQMEIAKEISMGVDGVRKVINRIKIRKNR